MNNFKLDNSVDPEEMPQIAALHKGLHYLVTLFILGTCKQVLWQTVKTQKKCHIMRHFIRVCTVCKDKTEIYHYLEISTCGSLKYKMGISILILSTWLEKSIQMKKVTVKNNL